MPLQDVRNFREVDERLTTCGQPSEDQLASAQASGVEVVINLALHDDSRYSLADERGAVESLGMSYIHIPVQFGAPTESDLVAFFDAMEEHQAQRVLVHCAANYRVTVFLGLYRRIRRGWSVDDAFQLMHTVWEPNEVWSRFIAAMLEKHRDVHTGESKNALIQLKPVELADAGIIFEAWGRDPENFNYLTAGVFADLQDAERYVTNLFLTPRSRAFHILHEAGGVVGIVKAAIHEHRAQIGYVVHRPFWGQGIATAAVRRLVGLVEEDPAISRVWATCALDNPASARVLEKCGFQREAVLKNWVIYPAQGGRAFDNYSYVKLPGAAIVQPRRP